MSLKASRFAPAGLAVSVCVCFAGCAGHDDAAPSAPVAPATSTSSTWAIRVFAGASRKRFDLAPAALVSGPSGNASLAPAPEDDGEVADPPIDDVLFPPWLARA